MDNADKFLLYCHYYNHNEIERTTDNLSNMLPSILEVDILNTIVLLTLIQTFQISVPCGGEGSWNNNNEPFIDLDCYGVRFTANLKRIYMNKNKIGSDPKSNGAGYHLDLSIHSDIFLFHQCCKNTQTCINSGYK